MIAAVAAAFGGIQGAGGETGAIFDGVYGALSAMGLGGLQSLTKPAAYLNYLIFDRSFSYIDGGFTATVDNNQGVMQQFSMEGIEITKPGFIFIYLSNESEATTKYILFDEMNVTLTRPIIQVADYYPYGYEIKENSYENILEQKNHYKYNGKELQEDLDLNWYDYGARFYDPAIGRFFTQDWFAEKYFDFSPYQYGANNPMLYVDVNGDSIVSIVRQNNQILIENSPLEKGGKNFTNLITFRNGAKDSHVTDKSAGVVNDAMVSIGDTEVAVSSGYRSPEKQAEVMYDNIELEGVESQKNLYGSAGDIIINVYIEAKGKTDKQGNKMNDASGIKSAMLSKIKAIGPGKVSKHSSDPKVYNVFDIAPSSVSNGQGFHNALIGDKRVQKVLSPYSKRRDPAFHVEIPQK
jgi:RHS repeat-associated protein